MNEYLVVRLDDNLKIVGVDKRRTEGLAHQLATRIADAGYRVRVVCPNDAEDVMFLWNQVDQKRTMGFIEEYGIIPNGNRSRGEGARGIGRMIYPPLGVEIEGPLPQKSTELSGSVGLRESDVGVKPGNISAPLSLSSANVENEPQKILEFPKKFTLKIGGRVV